jgi:uncharacterized UPF0160 family protein
VKHFTIIIQPLTKLLKKGALFVWAQLQKKAFHTLKQDLVTTSVLALPNFTKTFVLEIDASDSGIGVVLMQEGHPLAFLSKSLGLKSRDLSTYEKEYMAILIAVQQQRPYLQQGKFHIYTDHKILAQLNEQRLHTDWQHKIFSRLLGL